MLRRLQQNWQLKLLSLGIALLVWLYVLEQRDPWERKDVIVPVKVSGLATDQMATEIKPSSVTATFEGRRESLALLAAKPPEAVASVTGRALGTHEVPVAILASALPRGTRLDRLALDQVTVTLDERVEEKRVLWVDVRGRPAPEYQVKSYQREVNEVTLSGPREVVANARAVAPVDVSGMDTDRTLTARVEARDAQGVRLDKVLVAPAQVEVTIHLDRVNVKTVPVVLGRVQVPAGKRVTSVSLDPQIVTLSGEPAVLAHVESVATEPLTIQGAGGHYTVPIRAPQGTAIASDASIRVSIQVGPIQLAPLSANPPAPRTQEPPWPPVGGQPGSTVPAEPGPGQPEPGPAERGRGKTGPGQTGEGADSASDGTPAGGTPPATENTDTPPG